MRGPPKWRRNRTCAGNGTRPVHTADVPTDDRLTAPQNRPNQGRRIPTHFSPGVLLPLFGGFRPFCLIQRKPLVKTPQLPLEARDQHVVVK